MLSNPKTNNRPKHSMNPNKYLHGALLFLAPLALLQAQTPPAQSDSELITLPEFSISSKRADAYRAVDEIAAVLSR